MPEPAGPWKAALHKALFRGLCGAGPRCMWPFVFPRSLTYYDVAENPGVQGLVALTIDDGICRQEPEKSMAEDVRQVLAAHGAKATFFLCADHVRGLVLESAARALAADGHELANHCAEDRDYSMDSESSFEEHLLRTEQLLDRLQAKPSLPKGQRLFRSPMGRQSEAMARVLERHGYADVMFDSFADDGNIADPVFLAQTLVDSAVDGSIVLMHMPERGFREWNLQELELTVRGLQARGLTPVTFSTLQRAAQRSQPEADTRDYQLGWCE